MFSHRGAVALFMTRTVQSLWVVVLVVTFFIYAPSVHLPCPVAERLGHVWLVLADSAWTLPVQLLQALSVAYISLAYQEALRNGCFSAKGSSPRCLPLIMQMWFSHAGFEVSFAFHAEHMIGSFNFLVWVIDSLSAVLTPLLSGIFSYLLHHHHPPLKKTQK